METNQIYCMDCMEGLRLIPDKSIDLILTDSSLSHKKHQSRRQFRLSDPFSLSIPS